MQPQEPASDGDQITEFYRPDTYLPMETVGYMIRTVHLSINKMIDVEMQKYDLTAMQWRPLLFIYFGKVKTAAALAKETCMDTGATTRMLDRLQNKGLLARTRCDQDRRIVHLALTDEGQRICEKIPTDLCKVMNQHLKGFNQQEVDTLKNFLDRMQVNGLIT
jgi:DNA-binding MarR family transcriptional regulator